MGTEHCGLGKCHGRACKMIRNAQPKIGQMFYLVNLQKIIARKVASQKDLKNYSKVIREARIHNVKLLCITAYYKNDTSQMNDFHVF